MDVGNNEKTKKTVVIDIDGVILDLCSKLEESLKSKGYTNFEQRRILTYDFNKSLNRVPAWLLASSNNGVADNYMNAPRHEIFKCLGSEDLFTTANFYEKSIEGLNKLCSSDKYNVILYTLSYTDNVSEIKEKRIKRAIWGTYSYKGVVGMQKACYTEDKVDYVIEDSIENLNTYANNKDTKLFLVNRSYNREEYNNIDFEYNRVDALNDFVDYLLSIA